MFNFIEDYLTDPSKAFSSAAKSAAGLSWCDAIDDENIYRQLSEPDFRLYETIIFSTEAEDSRATDSLRPVA